MRIPWLIDQFHCNEQDMRLLPTISVHLATEGMVNLMYVDQLRLDQQTLIENSNHQQLWKKSNLEIQEENGLWHLDWCNFLFLFSKIQHYEISVVWFHAVFRDQKLRSRNIGWDFRLVFEIENCSKKTSCGISSQYFLLYPKNLRVGFLPFLLPSHLIYTCCLYRRTF